MKACLSLRNVKGWKGFWLGPLGVWGFPHSGELVHACTCEWTNRQPAYRQRREPSLWRKGETLLPLPYFKKLKKISHFLYLVDYLVSKFRSILRSVKWTRLFFSELIFKCKSTLFRLILSPLPPQTASYTADMSTHLYQICEIVPDPWIVGSWLCVSLA